MRPNNEAQLEQRVSYFSAVSKEGAIFGGRSEEKGKQTSLCSEILQVAPRMGVNTVKLKKNWRGSLCIERKYHLKTKNELLF